MSRFTESIVEEGALTWLDGLDYTVLYGPGIAFGMPAAERSVPNYRDVLLERRLRQALARLNPSLPPAALVGLRPAWQGDEDDQGALKVIMTGSASDPLD